MKRNEISMAKLIILRGNSGSGKTTIAKKLQKNTENIIYITHYPPFNKKREPSKYTTMLEEYGVSYVVFGHLHGYVNPNMLYNEINGIKYYLTSCDAVKNKLVKIV